MLLKFFSSLIFFSSLSFASATEGSDAQVPNNYDASASMDNNILAKDTTGLNDNSSSDLVAIIDNTTANMLGDSWGNE